MMSHKKSNIFSHSSFSCDEFLVSFNILLGQGQGQEGKSLY